MSLEVFEATLKFIGDDSLAIGGGEPTLHPQFWAFMGIALGETDNVWLATNGSQTATAIRLARMAKRGIIGCALSQDCFHGSIDQAVVKAFKRANRHSHLESEDDRREIRDVSRHVYKHGRAVKTRVWDEEKGCVCEDTFVDPDGDIFTCGCKKLKIGNVLTGYNAAGKLHAQRYEKKRWDDIEQVCLFNPYSRTALYKSYVSYLRSAK